MKWRSALPCLVVSGLVCCTVVWPKHAQALPASPQLISTCSDLQNIDNDMTGWYKLANDIDCSGTNFQPLGVYTVTDFTGLLDGDGHAINHLTMSWGNYGQVGMFGSLGAGATVKNLSLNDAVATLGGVSGIVAGSARGTAASGGATTIDNVHVTGQLTAGHAANGITDVGGIVGYAENVAITNSSSQVQTSLTEITYGGGLVGRLQGGSISHSSTSGTLSCADNGNADCFNLGGLAGYAIDATLSDLHSSVNLSGDLRQSGGLVGYLQGNTTTTRVYATGDVSGTGELGGLVGQISSANNTIDQAYATGNVTASGSLSSGVGGLLGWVIGPVVSNAFASGTVTNNGDTALFTGGLVGADVQQGTYNNIYASGTVSAQGQSTTSYVGGLFGILRLDSHAYDSFAYSPVSAPTASLVGGFAGSFNTGTGSVSNDYYDQQRSTQPTCGDDPSLCTAGKVAAVNTDGSQAAYFLNNHSVAPYSNGATALWDFTNVWQQTCGTPELRFAPRNLCAPSTPVNNVSSTSTSSNGTSQAAPVTTASSSLPPTVTGRRSTDKPTALANTGQPLWLPTTLASAFVVLALAVLAYRPAKQE